MFETDQLRIWSDCSSMYLIIRIGIKIEHIFAYIIEKYYIYSICK